MKHFIYQILDKLGYTIIKKSQADLRNIDILQDNEFMKIYRICSPYTMTSIERMYSLYTAIQYVDKCNIEGDFVECGVWKGGSSMLMALAHLEKKRNIYLYDTFEGMTEPTEVDESINGSKALSTWDNIDKCEANIEEVKRNLFLTKYDINKLHFIAGKVEDTIPSKVPEKISLLRLDTDWFESTYHEMKFLYPLLQPGGILLIDDYGHWDGSRKAIDAYCKENNLNLFLNRIDYTGRISIKK